MIPYLDSQYKYISSMVIYPVKRAAQQVQLPEMPTLPHFPGPLDLFSRIARNDAADDDQGENDEDCGNDVIMMQRNPWLRSDGDRAVREHFISSCPPSTPLTEDDSDLPAFSNPTSSSLTSELFDSTTAAESEDMERTLQFCRLEYDPSRETEDIIKEASTGLDDWDIIQSSDVSYHRNSALTPSPQSKGGKRGGAAGGSSALGSHDTHLGGDGGASESTKLLQTSLEDTFHKMTRALNINDKREHGVKKKKPFRYLVPPLKDNDFRKHLDEEGRLIKPEELRLLIYQIGVEHSLRKVVWKHLLNVYPTSPCTLTGAERYEYMRVKCLEYHKLKKRWQNMGWEAKKKVVSSIRKDVLRTDRSHAFYSDMEVDFEKNPTNPHLTSLFDILMTFAMSFPQISYCQGMSDLASPLLLIMQDEAVTYVCFCALMRRLQQNFTIDSKAMQIKFDHLKLLLRYVDPELHHYLAKGCETFEMFFCYRWLLLEMKREFALDDALLMLEVMWASIPPNPPPDKGGIQLCNTDILATLDACSTFSSPSHKGDSEMKMNADIDPACAYRLASLDAANYDLIEWSKDQNSKTTNLASPDTSNFDHLRSKVPSNEADTMSHRSSLSIDDSSDDLYRNSFGDDYSNSVSNIHNLKQADLVTNICNSTIINDLQNLKAAEAESGNDTNRLSEAAHTNSSGNCSSPTNIKNCSSSSSNQSAAKSQVSSGVSSAPHSKTSRCRTMSHATSCPSLDEMSDTSDLGTAESSLLEGGGATNTTTTTNSSSCCISPAESSCNNVTLTPTHAGAVTPTSVPVPVHHHSATSHPPLASKGHNLIAAPTMTSQNNVQYSSKACSGGVVKSCASPQPPCTPCSEMKRTKSSVDVSPQSRKDGSVEFSYDFVEDIEAQLNDTGGVHKVILPAPAEFGCGNPFLLFMCITLIIQQKQKIFSQDMDLTDVSGFFFRLVRGHDVHKVLSHARMLFADYLRTQPWTLDSDC